MLIITSGSALAPCRARFIFVIPFTSAYVYIVEEPVSRLRSSPLYINTKSNGSPYWITERRVPELIPVLCSPTAGDVSHKPGGSLPLLSARPAVTPATRKMAATSFAAW